jgi:N-acetyl-anhydromuramyl-L-alanine amidase AmpD
MQGGVAWLTNEASGVSADFMVSKAGVIVKLNPDMKSFYTWHAGKSKFGGRSDVNEISIGIEHEHFDGDEWPGAQVEASGKLCAWLVEEFGLDLSDGCITSHRAIALPRGRKSDPREFPWVLFSGIVRRWLDGI